MLHLGNLHQRVRKLKIQLHIILADQLFLVMAPKLIAFFIVLRDLVCLLIDNSEKDVPAFLEIYQRVGIFALVSQTRSYFLVSPEFELHNLFIGKSVLKLGLAVRCSIRDFLLLSFRVVGAMGHWRLQIKPVQNALGFFQLSDCILVLLILHVAVCILVILQHLFHIINGLSRHRWQRS